MQTLAPKMVNRAAGPRPAAAVQPVHVSRTPGRFGPVGGAGGMRSPHLARMAGAIVQREPLLARQQEGVPDYSPRGGGQRLYRTHDNQMVELPPEMTEAQAASLETEARAAEKQLGKGPPPKPVPEVRKRRKPEVKKEPRKPLVKGKRDDRGKAKAAPQARAAAALLKGVGPGKVAQYLAGQGTPTLLRGAALLQRLKRNEQTHDDATEKLKQAEKAVVIPPAEGQSKSNTAQVDAISAKPAPVADENKAKQQLRASLEDNIPRSIEDVDNFKRDRKAQHIGADVMTVVQGDKNAVLAAFGEMEQTPAPAPPEHTPELLPPAEVAPSTPTMNLGEGAVAPLLKEHTDVSNYTKEADSRLKEEGVTQEQLDMVDSGDLAAANKEKKGMEKTAKTEPLVVLKFARQEADQVARDLKQDEKRERGGLQAKRRAGLAATSQKQKGAKSALEKKREEVAAKINGIFQAAQDKVKKRLANLETESMKRFDDGTAQATKEFEDNVNREMAAFKAERYSGFWGRARKLKDWLLGMDDLPQVKAIFERNRAAFVSTVGKLVDEITADNKRVIQECRDELAGAKKAIKEYVDKLGPGLKDIGNKAAAEMNSKLAGLDQFINQKEQELQQRLADKQKAAIKAIDEKVEKMKEAMAGALSKLGKLLLLAAKKFFTWALQKFGYSLEEIEGIISKGAAVLKAIFTKPIQFVKNLIRAASAGFKNFGKNFLTHLKNAIFDWLTGSLEGIQLPATWDLKGIASVALQMLRLTWQNIRSKLVKLMGETAVKAMETGFDLVVTLVKDGPMAAWEKIQEMAGDIKDAFVEAVKGFVKTKVVQKAIETILSLFVPGAGIVRAIVGIYDTIVFFIKKAKQIAQMVGNFLASIGEIAMGNIGAAADALEQGLATALKLVINFLVRFLRLDGITAKIRNAIQKLGDKADKMLDKVAAWIADKAHKLGRAVRRGTTYAASRVMGWLGLRKRIRLRNQEQHTLYFGGTGERTTLLIATNPVAFATFLNTIRNVPPALRGDRETALRCVGEIARLETESRTTNVDHSARIQLLLEEIGRITIELLNSAVRHDVRTTNPTYAGLSRGRFGAGMRVMLATNELRRGTPPRVSGNAVFDTLNLRREGRGSYYILGHLLSEKLGGSGTDWCNLTPLSRSGNADHERKVESIIKPTTGDTPRAFLYVVTPSYGRSVNRGLITTIQSPANADPRQIKDAKAAIVTAEQFVPVSVVCSISEIDPLSGQPAGIKETYTIPNPIDQSSPLSYQL